MAAKKIEIAYREPGKSWKRKTVAASKLEKALALLAEKGAEVLTRDAE